MFITKLITNIMKGTFICLLSFFIIVSNLKFSISIDPNKVVIAINCGGEEYTDGDGTVYEADNYFSTGTSSDHGSQYDIELTKDEELYHTERWADKDLEYNVPFNVDIGKFVLILKFSEVYFQQAGEKVFDIALGKKIVIKDLDIFDMIGKAKAHDEYVEFEIKEDGLLYYAVRIYYN